jgi:hypothetical protein
VSRCRRRRRQQEIHLVPEILIAFRIADLDRPADLGDQELRHLPDRHYQFGAGRRQRRRGIRLERLLRSRTTTSPPTLADRGGPAAPSSSDPDSTTPDRLTVGRHRRALEQRVDGRAVSVLA